jgi:hypothetical protein
MGYLITYLLLLLAGGLMCKLVSSADSNSNVVTVRRRLWSDSMYDCYSKKNSSGTLCLHRVPQQRRHAVLTEKTMHDHNTIHPLLKACKHA